jgi:hypothetical protein
VRRVVQDLAANAEALQDQLGRKDADPVQVRQGLTKVERSLAALSLAYAGRLDPATFLDLSPYGRVQVPGRTVDETRARNQDGARNALPAANVAALGRTLYTDHLIAVELAGTLLLVATVGAIAIAGARLEKRR